MLGATIQRVIARTGLTRADGEEIRATLLCSLVAQDMRKLRAFEAARGARLGTWLVMLARNTAWDYVRRESRTTSRTVPEDAGEVASSTDDPLQVLVAKEGCLRLLDALTHLSSRDRHFVDLVFFEGCPLEVVALRLQVSVHTVYNKKTMLKELLTASLVH